MMATEARSGEDCNDCHMGRLTKERVGYCKLIEGRRL